ncbi:DUF2897 family protein [Thalassotalea sp. PLHSN55]|uniref:DUF2897 family protein n=1 Tax=Thalassotalea sp. PLHSN55 TaxID=3435888 RepID=UPI003F834D28
MSATGIVIIIIALGVIVSAILLLKQSATKFHLSQKQLDDIKARNKELDKEEEEKEKEKEKG